MRRYIPKEIEDEEKKLIQILLESDELCVDEVIDRYASDKYKKFIYEDEKRVNDLWKQGIIAG